METIAAIIFLSPVAADFFEAWEINRRVFEIALETVTIRAS
ncbi:MAG: hypothetical protein ACK5JR_02525 [Tropicimonas sp.]